MTTVTYTFSGVGVLGSGLWTQMVTSSGSVSQGSGKATATGLGQAYWSGGADFANNHYVKGQIYYVGGVFGDDELNAYLLVRASGSGTDFISGTQSCYYGLLLAEGTGVGTFPTAVHFYIGKLVNGVHTLLANILISSWPWVEGDEMYVEVLGTTINLKWNGVTKLSTTDSALVSGRPGFGGLGSLFFDNFEAGDLGRTFRLVP